jgi:hypothetical protein
MLTLLVAASVFLNGVNIDGAKAQSFEKCRSARVDEKGNVHLDCPGYQAEAAGAGALGADAWEDRMAALHEQFHLVVERLAADGGLAAGWTPARATDWIWARSQVASWQHLVVDRGWPPEEYAERSVASILAEVAA